MTELYSSLAYIIYAIYIFGFIFSFFITISPLALFIALIYIFKNKNINFSDVFNFRFVIRLYSYFVLFISMMFIIFSTITITKAILTYPFKLDFSYSNNNSSLFSAKSLSNSYDDYNYLTKKSDNIILKENRKKDLILSSSILVIFVPLFVIHKALLILTFKKEYQTTLFKIYSFFNLTIITLFNLITIPFTVNTLVNFALEETKATIYHPGNAISITFVLTLSWIILLGHTVFFYKKNNK